VTCKDLHNPRVCALIREDKHCFKKRQKIKQNENEPENEHEKEPEERIN